MQTFECPNCNAGVPVSDDPPKSVICNYCGTNVIVPEALRSNEPTPTEDENSPFLIAVGAIGVGMIGMLCVFAVLLVRQPPDAAEPTTPPTPTIPTPTATPPPTATEVPWLLRIGTEEAGTGAGRFEDVRWVGIDGKGSIYAAEHGGRIQQFTAEGDFVRQWNGVSDLPIADFAVAQDGTVYVAQGSQIGIYREGAFVREIDEISDFGVRSFALTPADTLIAANSDTLLFLDEAYQPTGQVEGAVGNRADSPIAQANMGVGPDGTIYMVSTFNDHVFVLDSEGVYQDRIGPVDGPFGVTTDRRGRIFVGAFTTIPVFAPDGRQVASFTPLERGSLYMGLAVDAADNLYIASRTQVFKLALPEF